MQKGARSLDGPPADRGTVELGTILLGIVGLMAAAAGATFVVDSALEMGQKGTVAATAGATQQGSALTVLEVRGEREGPLLVRLRELVSSEGAASEVQLSTVSIRFSLGGEELTFRYSESVQEGSFTVVPVRDLDASLSSPERSLNEGDLAELVLELGPIAPLFDVQGVISQSESGLGIRTTESSFQVAAGPTGNILRIL